MANAFVVKSEVIRNQLKSNVTVKYNGKEVEAVALWDTGATNSNISMDVVQQLELIPTGKMRVYTPSGTSDRNTYLVDVMLPSNVPIMDLMVCDSEIGDQGLGMLIGMDIINRGEFLVTNFEGKTKFSFRTPPELSVDFAGAINMRNLIGPTHGQGNRRKKHK